MTEDKNGGNLIIDIYQIFDKFSKKNKKRDVNIQAFD